MIPFDFIYCRPDSLRAAAATYTELRAAGVSVLYYGGGSEIITMARAGSIRPGAVIDLKSIPECLALEYEDDMLIIGAGNTLNEVKESRMFPLMRNACGRVADHTNQCRITLGGNLCGTIIYRETSLPLMLAEAEVSLYGPDGARVQPFEKVFQRQMNLNPGEFVYQAAFEKIDYPLVNVTALRHGAEWRVAFSGVCAFPFRSREIERVLNDHGTTPQARVDALPALLPEPAHTDVEGSGAYRLFVLKHTLLKLLEEWENGSI